ncbi:hypothetical protein SAMN02745196_01090 [Clostridium collagenovorans DSM 3089]|uniref:Bacteriocin (Lactococcin_972) n=1 Tax=Clostridium collagenovorans DSM 3089 TaxID=1121306 RepID=A0A1M5V3W3_9CLOT|nr:hypothetical protein [Clostridium collagenovorans]SHH69921.1 hypothetical protein SAMN02745196_01090 [Clostridium collagenovorans DSM 3089]
MKNKKIKLFLSLLIAGGVSLSAISAFAATAQYGITLNATGSHGIGNVKKDSKYPALVNNVTHVDSGDRYDFWGYKIGNSITSDETNRSSAHGTGPKYAYYVNESHASALIGTNIGLGIKTGPTVYHKMFVSGTYTP